MQHASLEPGAAGILLPCDTPAFRAVVCTKFNCDLGCKLHDVKPRKGLWPKLAIASLLPQLGKRHAESM